MPRFLTRIELLFCFISLENLTSYVLEGLLGCLNMLAEKIPKYSPQPDLMVELNLHDLEWLVWFHFSFLLLCKVLKGNDT